MVTKNVLYLLWVGKKKRSVPFEVANNYIILTRIQRQRALIMSQSGVRH